MSKACAGAWRQGTDSWERGNVANRAGLGLLLVVLSTSCDLLSSSEGRGGDCKTQRLARVEKCQGRDDSFTECRFFQRASGAADRAWCELLSKGASGPAGSGASAPLRCEPTKVEDWVRVDCSAHGVKTRGNCFSCVDASSHETRLEMVHAFSDDCLRAVEQTTCNVSVETVLSELGPARP